MLLQDLGFNRTTKIAKINKFLRESFKITLNDDIDQAALVEARRTTLTKIAKLKMQENASPKDLEYAKQLLILEGLDLLISHKINENETSYTAHSSSDRYVKIIDGLSAFVVKNAELGDDFDQAVEAAMREYRSSKWRFQDYEVEHDVRKSALDGLAEIDRAHATNTPQDQAAAFLGDRV